jgi:hypothetical protein
MPASDEGQIIIYAFAHLRICTLETPTGYWGSGVLFFCYSDLAPTEPRVETSKGRTGELMTSSHKFKSPSPLERDLG